MAGKRCVQCGPVKNQKAVPKKRAAFMLKYINYGTNQISCSCQSFFGIK